ncbi:MAG TPA: ERF family protein [Blastocatellia bacterium]|nr:ERF family protein [Blastocatellia bacterium]
MGQIYELMSKVMADVPVIEKLREHQQQRWTYRGFEDFLAAFRPALLKHGLFLVPEVLDTETGTIPVKDGKEMRHILVRVAYTVFAPDGSMVRSVVIGESWDAQDNASTKAMDDAFTTFLTQTFCVPTGDSPTEKASKPKQERKASADGARQQKPASRPQESKPAPAADLKPSEDVDLDARAKRLIEERRVSRTDSGYSVRPNDKVTYQVCRNQANKVLCNCDRFDQKQESDPNFRCEHILAVFLFAKLQPVAA